MVKTIRLSNNDELPVLFSQRAIMSFENKTKVPIIKMMENYKTEHMVTLALEAVNAGYRYLKQDEKQMTLNELLDLDDVTGCVNMVLELYASDEKK